jgi:hypothetical protein
MDLSFGITQTHPEREIVQADVAYDNTPHSSVFKRQHLSWLHESHWARQTKPAVSTITTSPALQ